ncbi:MAG: MMPL family transporter [Chloroflexi bacterium]|jgi:putative drug exporter of the RND superfamily|nr:MMPL family transporter [Chloroflexota bacterium]MBT4073022.1 MMPL family transporter [Chloroflexota bacterium]MBT4516085.1 MMPL family transporter [Chloroflexota bacterium]MBT5319077.1 MMPL family transporter [Chloroflexota bacterium]MBT6682919.1 MMPL family transporter [Chloroflexota bacterium]
MASAFSTAGLARSSALHPKRMLAVWLVTVVASVAIASALCGSAITNEVEPLREIPESIVATNLLEEHLRGPQDTTEILIVQSAEITVDQPAFQERVNSLSAAIALEGEKVVDGIRVVEEPSDFNLDPAAGQVSGDGHAAIMFIRMGGELDDAIDNIPPIRAIVEEANGEDGFEVLIVGSVSLGEDLNKIAEQDLMVGEGLGILAALIILAIVFGTLASTWIPIVMAIFSIILAIAAAAIIGQVQQVSFFIVNMITMIGLAVGIDYSLFIVSRYREEREAGVEKIEAIERTGSTASRAVFFSGVTVVIALIGMLIVPTSIFFSLGLGAILVAIMAIIATLTLLPALLSLMGDKINSWRVPLVGRRSGASNASNEGAGGFWNAITGWSMNHPVVGIVIAGGALLVLASFTFDMKLGSAGISTFPDHLEGVQGFRILQDEFSVGLIAETEIVIDGVAGNPGVDEAVGRLQESFASEPSLGDSSYVTSPDGEIGVLSVPINADPASDAAYEVVQRIRDIHVPHANIPADVYVGGSTAETIDFINLTEYWLPVVMGFILTLSFVLLTVVFRSIVVPVKAIIMNLLSVGATYGLLVIVFQNGVGSDLFGFVEVEAIESWVPLFLFAVLFGLSMDYHVILLSRIRERYDQTGDNPESVAYGVRTTAGMITGAAIIMVAVFLGFALGQLSMFQQMGFGLAVAVFLDATVVRSILVPCSMRLLGDANWYLPGFLEWVPDLRVREGTIGTQVSAGGDSD